MVKAGFITVGVGLIAMISGAMGGMGSCGPSSAFGAVFFYGGLLIVPVGLVIAVTGLIKKYIHSVRSRSLPTE
jgi:hypothetical protein